MFQLNPRLDHPVTDMRDTQRWLMRLLGHSAALTERSGHKLTEIRRDLFGETETNGNSRSITTLRYDDGGTVFVFAAIDSANHLAWAIYKIEKASGITFHDSEGTTTTKPYVNPEQFRLEMTERAGVFCRSERMLT